MTWLARPDPAAAVMSLPCPVCAAPAGAPCDPWSDTPGLLRPPCGMCGDPAACPRWCDAAAGLVLPGGDPDRALHTGRVLAAAATGLVSREALLAQFGDGDIPPSLTGTPDQEAWR